MFSAPPSDIVIIEINIVSSQKRRVFMKKLCLLSGMMVFVVACVNASEVRKTPGKIKESQRQKIEDVQWEKIKRQQHLARPAIYTMVDALIKEENSSGHTDDNGQYIEDTPARVVVDWPAVFIILDKMKGIINVNEYITFENGDSLLWVAVEQGNFSVAKTLLEKYKADPNFGSQCTGDHDQNVKCNMNRTILVLAREKKDLLMAMLLRQHGARM